MVNVDVNGRVDGGVWTLSLNGGRCSDTEVVTAKASGINDSVPRSMTAATEVAVTMTDEGHEHLNHVPIIHDERATRWIEGQYTIGGFEEG